MYANNSAKHLCILITQPSFLMGRGATCVGWLTLSQYYIQVMALTNDEWFFPKVIGNPKDDTLLSFFRNDGVGGHYPGWVYVDSNEGYPVQLAVVAAGTFAPPSFYPASIGDGFEGWNNSFLTVNGQSKFSVLTEPPFDGKKSLFWGLINRTQTQLEPTTLRIFDFGSS